MTWFEYIKSLSFEEMAEFLSSYRCGNCIRRMNNCFPRDVEDWLKSTTNRAESLETSE